MVPRILVSPLPGLRGLSLPHWLKKPNGRGGRNTEQGFSRMYKVARRCALLVVSHLSFAANAACTDFSRSACRLEALLEADSDLNAVYSKVLGTRSESERGELRGGGG